MLQRLRDGELSACPRISGWLGGVRQPGRLQARPVTHLVVRGASQSAEFMPALTPSSARGPEESDRQLNLPSSAGWMRAVEPFGNGMRSNLASPMAPAPGCRRITLRRMDGARPGK